MSEILIASFYKFAHLYDLVKLQESLLACCKREAIFGTILLAPEGINGTIAGLSGNIERVFEFLRAESGLSDLQYKSSWNSKMPFKKLKVRIKREIVTFGQEKADPLEQVGTYVSAKDWNNLIKDPQVVLIDTRNHYEVEIGTFQGALDPHTESFGEFAEYVRQNLDPQKHKKIAMFCTGGIRCEKATSFMLKEGFEQVYHLQGGILEYLRQVKAQESLWQGECFVFDDRVALKIGLEQGTTKMCFGCGLPIASIEQDCPNCRSKLQSDSQPIGNSDAT